MRIGAVTPALAPTLTLRVGKAANCGEVKATAVRHPDSDFRCGLATAHRSSDQRLVLSGRCHSFGRHSSSAGILRYRPAQLLRRGHRRAIIGDIDFSLDPAEQLDQSRAVASIIC